MYVYLFPLQDKGKDGHIRKPEEDRGTIQYSANGSQPQYHVSYIS